jgi:hypothetical protein
MRRSLVALGFAWAFGWPAPALAQETYRPPRAADGHPDLQGVWATGFLTALERPDDIPDLIVPPEQAPALAAKFLSYTPDVVDPDANFITHFTLAVVRGTYRSSLLVEPRDGKLPFTPAALAAVARGQRSSFDDPEERPTVERCLIGWGQAPMRPEHGFTPVQIVQTPDAIVIQTEDVGGLRIIHMTGDPPPNAVRSYEGWSRGRWEGETLVVETTHLRADDPLREHFDRPIIVGPNSRIIERFTRLSDTELLEQFTVEDPTLYTRPWMAEFSLTLTDKPSYEYACHEANYSLTGILTAARLGRQ